MNSGADFGLDSYDSLTNKGTGTNMGGEITVEHFLKNGFYFLATGPLINSKYKGSDGIERNAAFNIGHVVNLLAGKEFKLGKKGSVLALNIRVVGIQAARPHAYRPRSLAGKRRCCLQERPRLFTKAERLFPHRPQDRIPKRV